MTHTEPDTLTPAQIRACGYLLYGATWPKRIAEKIGMSERFLQRVAAAGRLGEPFDIPPGVVRDIRALAEKRARELQAAAAELQTSEDA